MLEDVNRALRTIPTTNITQTKELVYSRNGWLNNQEQQYISPISRKCGHEGNLG